MISDEALETLLRAAGGSYEVPSDGVARVVAAAREAEPPPAARRLARFRAAPAAWRTGALAAAAIAVVAAVAVGIGVTHGDRATSTSSGSAGSAGGGTVAPELGAPLPPVAGTDRAAPVPAAAAAGGAAAAPAAPPVPGAAPVAGAQPRVVQTGSVTLAVDKGRVSATLGQVQGAATGLGGYLAASKTDEAGPSPSGSVTLRVPAGAFPQLLARVRALGTVTSVVTGGRDVTGEYADLEARLRALRASRETYLTLLGAAKSVQETLSVQQRVDDVQQQIEQLDGQRKVLADQSDLATLDVQVGEKGDPAVVLPPPARTGFSKALHDAWTSFRTGLEGVVAATGVLALLVLAGLVAFLAYRLGRRMYRRRLV